MNDQYRGSIKQRFAWEDVGGANIPQGLFTDFNEKYKAWEKRRGLVNETDFNGNPFDKNEKKPNPVRKLRGRPLALKLALDNKKKTLAKTAETAAKKAVKKGLKDPRANSKFAPEIVGMQFASGNNAQRKIKQYILKNHLIIPADYEFGVNKVDWGKYEITGNRIQIKK